jgi:hypothetical protein
MSKYEKRDSPSYSAQDYPNKIKIGNNGLKYVSKSDKNKVFRWYKIKDMNECNNPDKYYMQFPENYLQKKFYKYNTIKVEEVLNKVKEELILKNIYLIKIGWKNNYNLIDNAFDEATEFIIKKYFKDKKLSKYEILDSHLANFIFYTENRLFWSKNSGELSLQWVLYKNSKKEAFDILRKYFKNKFIEPKSSSKTITIKLNKLN